MNSVTNVKSELVSLWHSWSMVIRCILLYNNIINYTSCLCLGILFRYWKPTMNGKIFKANLFSWWLPFILHQEKVVRARKGCTAINFGPSCDLLKGRG